MNLAKSAASFDRRWDEGADPGLVDYVRVPPSRRPSTPAGRRTVISLGGARRARLGGGAAHRRHAARDRDDRGAHALRVLRRAGHLRPGNDRTVLFYGHLDKQPEMEGWRDGFGPWRR